MLWLFCFCVSAVLKDVTESPMELLKCVEMDATRMALYPNLDYKGLYMALQQMVDVAPLIQFGLHGMYLRVQGLSVRRDHLNKLLFL